MDLGQRLRQERTKAGITQEDLAKQLGVSRQTISNWENSRSAPDIGSITKLGKLYQISLDKLLNGEEVIQQFEDLAQQQRKRCQMLLEMGIILQPLGNLLNGLDFTFLGNIVTWTGFLLLTATILMHLRVFSHDRGEILRGIVGITGRWTLILGVLLVYGSGEVGSAAALVISTLNLVSMLLIWSARVWTIDWKSTRLWLIIVLWVGTPLLLSGLRLQDSGHLVDDNPFFQDYRVEAVLFGKDGQHALVELGDNSMILAMDGVNGNYIGRFEYTEPTLEDTAKGIWLLSPEEDPMGLYKLTLEADSAVCLSYTQDGQLQWKWRLIPDQLKGSLAIATFGHSSFREMEWYPNAISDLEDPTPYFKSTDVVQWADLTIKIAGSGGAPLVLYEEYHHEGGVDNTSFPLTANEKGDYEIKLTPRYGGEKKQYAVYRIPFDDGEFRFALTHQGF